MSTVRDSHTSEAMRPHPVGQCVEDNSTRRVYESLLGVRRPSPTGRFQSGRIEYQRIPAAQIIAQQEHASRVWAKRYPGKPAHFEIDASAIERRLFRHFSTPPWRLRVMRWFGFAAVAGIIWTGPKLTPADAAKILAASRVESNVATHPAPPPGSQVFIIGAPGALSWQTFPAEVPRRRLDGTLLDSRPPDDFWRGVTIARARRR